MILIIDNYDSFTYNLVQYIGEMNSNLLVKKNDEIDSSEINNLNCSHIIISPGPGMPCDAGASVKIIREFYKRIPILGVCLGHQAIGEVFGCTIKRHNSIFHGKISKIYNNNKSKLYKGVPESFEATRYHSLIIDKKSIVNQLIVNSWLEDGSVMGVEHCKYPLFGVQYHPESIETKYGKTIIKNFLYNCIIQ